MELFVFVYKMGSKLWRDPLAWVIEHWLLQC